MRLLPGDERRRAGRTVRRAGWRPGPVARVSLGLSLLLVSLLLVADVIFGLVPGQGQAQRALRRQMSEQLAVQATALVEKGDLGTLARTVQQVMVRESQLLAVVVRRQDGTVVLSRGVQAQAAAGMGTGADPRSDLDLVRVPILAGTAPWGEVMLRFAALERPGWRGWLAQPGVALLLLLGGGGFVLTYAYLRRAMQYLNPSDTIPDRVRKAYDNLTEGLLILDAQARIVLANNAFRALEPSRQDEAQAQGPVPLHGRSIDELTWLQAAAPEPGPAGAPVAAQEPPPWRRTLSSGETVRDVPWQLPGPAGQAQHVRVTSAPVTGPDGRMRGCMVSFNNVTELHRSYALQSLTMAELERSRAEVQAKNEELQRLASRDPMTGCLNRRAFFESAEAAFERALQEHTRLACVMSDIDHFKQFNDVYGHAVGDQVIQVVARALGAGIRQPDILCRYGGEEFCIVLPGADAAEAADVAERLRADIEANAQGAVRGAAVRRITSSFGVSDLAQGARTLQDLIEQADQALYRSKEAGRNRVSTHERALA